MGGADELRKSALAREEKQFSVDQNIREDEEKARIDILKSQFKGSEPPKQSDIAGLRKEFTTLSGDFIKVRDAYQRIKASAQDPSPAGDLSTNL